MKLSSAEQLPLFAAGLQNLIPLDAVEVFTREHLPLLLCCSACLYMELGTDSIKMLLAFLEQPEFEACLAKEGETQKLAMNF